MKEVINDLFFFGEKMKILTLCAATLLLGACSTQPLTKESLLYVNSETKECTGVAPMNCLQVKTAENHEWQLFYQQIEGFTFESGYQYQLQVNKEAIENPPSDGSSIKYSLVKVISKLPVR